MGELGRIIKFLLLIAGLIGIGTFGYSYFEGWSIFDSFYMTIITLTTTGYMEVHDLSDSGRAFTTILLIGGVGTFTFGLRQIVAAQFLVDFSKRRRKLMLAQIQELKDHAIICGFGAMGKIVCDELSEMEFPFVVIEKNEKRIEFLQETGFLYIHGDASDDNDLIEACIESAKVLVVSLDNDADTLYTLVAAKNINPDVYAICRATNEPAHNRLTRMGANRVVVPMASAAATVARLVVQPQVEDLVDLPNQGMIGDNSLSVVEWPINKGETTITDVQKIAEQTEFVVIGIQKPNHPFTFAPKPTQTLSPGDKIVGLCKPDKYEEIQKHL